jgi:multidrug resistance efflux pump
MCEVPAFVARPKFGHLAPKPATTRIYFYTTPIMPVVRGPVIEVPVQPDKPLKKGDVLFRIDPNSYEYALQQKRATLAEAEQTVKQLLAAAEADQAKVNEEIASRDRAKKIICALSGGQPSARRRRGAGRRLYRSLARVCPAPEDPP